MISIICTIAYGSSGLVRLLHLVWSVIECSDVFYAFKFGAMVIRSGGIVADFSQMAYSNVQCTFYCMCLFVIPMVLDTRRYDTLWLITLSLLLVLLTCLIQIGYAVSITSQAQCCCLSNRKYCGS